MTIMNSAGKLSRYGVSRDQFINAMNVLLSGRMILTGGNGGSLSDAEHFVAELTGRFDGITTPYPAVNMCSNGAELTAFANDYGYEKIFIPYIQAFEDFDPAFLFITTSGSSKNIVHAIEYIQNTYEHKTQKIVLLTGGNKTEFDKSDDVHIISIPSENTQLIQEMHIVILHEIASIIKKREKEAS